MTVAFLRPDSSGKALLPALPRLDEAHLRSAALAIPCPRSLDALPVHGLRNMAKSTAIDYR